MTWDLLDDRKFFEIFIESAWRESEKNYSLEWKEESVGELNTFMCVDAQGEYLSAPKINPNVTADFEIEKYQKVTGLILF